MQEIISKGMLPVLTLKMEKGEQIFTECGGMSWMEDGIVMQTTTNGGILKGLSRVFSDESFFLNSYICERDGAEIAFSSSLPGEIIYFNLAENQSIIAQKGSFMVGSANVDLKLHLRKRIRASIFGGEGFIMQRITGPGKVFLECDGNLVKKTIQKGETLKVDNGHIVAMTEGINMDIKMVKGIKNIIFGGEGLFLTTLSGEGTVWLQSMPVSKLAENLYPFFINDK